MKLNERLRKVRNDLGITQADFAKLGGVKVLAQANYERGVRVPSLEYLLKLKEEGLDVHYIMFGEEVDAGELTSLEHKLLFAYQNATEDRKRAIEFVAGIHDNNDTDENNMEDRSSKHQLKVMNDQGEDKNNTFSTYYWGDVGRNAFNYIFKVIPVISIILLLFLNSLDVLMGKLSFLFEIDNVSANVGSVSVVVVVLAFVIYSSLKIGEKLLNYNDSNFVRFHQLKALLDK